MNKNISILNVFKCAGAFMAFTIGSGFATGQEIMQFFTSSGLHSIGAIAISLVLFVYYTSVIIGAGYDYGSSKKYRPYKYFCGEKIGIVYEYFVSILLFLSVVIMISGSGATLKEYYGLSYYVGCAMMAILVLIVFLGGLDGIINIISVIGPVIVVFSLIVGSIIIFRNFDGFINISDTVNYISVSRTNRNWIESGILYASFNMVSSLFFFTSLGYSVDTREEAVYGSVLGSIILMLVILIMNLALLSQIDEIYNLSIPTLYFAQSISPVLGKIFSVILLCGIFSTAAPNFWVVCTRFENNKNINMKVLAIILSVMAFICGLLPFKKLVAIIYPFSGVLGILLLICIFIKQLSKRVI